MLSSFSRCALFFALTSSFRHVGGFMVKSVDGSYVPWSFVARAPGDSGISVWMTNNNDQSYLATVLMGSPSQQVQMAPSLSQNQISVATSPQGVADSTFYNPTISTSFVQGTAFANISTISGGSVTGRFGGERCTLQSATSALNFTYNASVVLTDPAVMGDLYPPGARGVLGYGVNPPADSPAGTSLMGSFLGTNFTNEICGIELNHRDDPFPHGILTMGAIDSSVVSGAFTNVKVPSTSPLSWSIPFDNLTFLSNGTNQTVAGSLASVDMYHSVIQVTTDVASQVYAGIPGSKNVSSSNWSLPCNASFPITLTFGGTPFSIFERDTIVKQADGSCIGVVTGGAQAIGKIGAPFMRNVYTQFLVDKAADGSVGFTIGFAAKNLRQVPLTPPSSSKATTIKPTSTSAAHSSGSRTLKDIHSLPTLMLVVISVAAVYFLELL